MLLRLSVKTGPYWFGYLNLYAVNPNGSLKWKFPTGGFINKLRQSEATDVFMCHQMNKRIITCMRSILTAHYDGNIRSVGRHHQLSARMAHCISVQILVISARSPPKSLPKSNLYPYLFSLKAPRPNPFNPYNNHRIYALRARSSETRSLFRHRAEVYHAGGQKDETRERVRRCSMGPDGHQGCISTGSMRRSGQVRKDGAGGMNGEHGPRDFLLRAVTGG